MILWSFYYKNGKNKVTQIPDQDYTELEAAFYYRYLFQNIPFYDASPPVTILAWNITILIC